MKCTIINNVARENGFFRNVNLIKQPNKQTIVTRPERNNNYLLRCVAKEFFSHMKAIFT